MFPSKDGNGITFAPMCRPDGNPKCFTSSNVKQCEHNVTIVKLDQVGDYVVFPSRFMHHGYYVIASNMTYYTLQLFCKITENPEVLQIVTRKYNNNMKHGRVIESRLTQLTQDICNN